MNENIKKEKLTFLEAVKVIEDGQCKEIRNEHNMSFFINKEGTLSYLGIENDEHDSGIRLRPASFLSKKWKLIGKIKQNRKTKIKMILEWEE